MSALEKIINEILEQADAQAVGIINDANQKAAEILQKGQADRDEWKRQFDETAEQERRERLVRTESTNRQNRRRALLDARNQVIDEVIAEAKAKLTLDADKERFKVTQQGNILMNNTIEAIFEADKQMLRDKAYEVLSVGV